MRKDLKKADKKQNNQTSERNHIFFDEEYIRKAEEMEKELFADGDDDEDEYTDEDVNRSYEELVNRLKADGIYEEDEDSDADVRRTSSSNEKIHKHNYNGRELGIISPARKRPGKVRWGKVASVAVLCCACIFAASMTSEANRNYFVNNIRVWSGNNTKTVIDNSEDNEVADTEEYEAMENIENQLGIEMPEFYYRPSGLEFQSYEVDTSTDIARIEYEYNSNIIVLSADKQNENTASQTVSLHGAKNTIVITKPEDIEITVERIQSEQDEEASYSAKWKLDDVVYYIAGRIPEKELEKMLKQMRF